MPLPPSSQLIMNQQGAAGRSGIQSNNAGMDNQAQALDIIDTTGTFRVGKVTRSDAGTNGIIVRCGGNPNLPCNMLVTNCNYYFGASESSLPPEGARVFVHMATKYSMTGVIVGVLPGVDSAAATNKERTEPSEDIRTMWEMEPSASGGTEKAYWMPQENEKRTDVLEAGAGRAIDALPGDKIIMNEQGVGIAVLRFIASLRGSDRAKIELSALDDRVNVVSGHWRHLSSQGEHQIFNDGGFVTNYYGGASYQCERSGYDAYGAAVLEVDDAKTLREGKQSRSKLVKEDIKPKTRFQMFSGFLGDVISLFVGKPDPAQNPELYSTDSLDQGLMQAHVDSSGRLLVRSASSISLQRWDRIPIPKLKKQPWDPSGDKMEDMDPKEKKPFNWPSQYIYARNLLLRDGYAWIQRLAYLRIHNQSTGDGKKDYYLPEEQDMKTPDNEYDKQGKGTEKFSESDLRQSFINQEEDGSIIIRDAWGSEIHMRGGNIVFNAAGQIEMRPGKSLVQLAGHDIIAKARKSVDITATDNDVRIKANTNLHMVAEGRDDEGGGILLESKSSDDSSQFKGRTGESVLSKGIQLIAKDSRVFSYGKKVHISATERMMIETFNEDGELDQGEIFIVAGRLITNTTRETVLTCFNKAAMVLSTRSAALVGIGSYLIAERSVAVTKGQKAWIPLDEVDIEANPYEDIQEKLEDVYQQINQSTDWLSPYQPDNRDEIEFTYRSSAEYGTLSATEITGGSTFFTFQAPWAFMAGKDHPLIGSKPVAWADFAIEDTYAWPGKAAYDGDTYVQLVSEKNIKTPEGIPVSRAELQPSPGELLPAKFSEYEVMPHT